MKLLRSLAVGALATAMIAGIGYAGIYNFPSASLTASVANQTAATLPMTGSECIAGDTGLSGGRAPQTACYTQGNLKGNYITTITSAATTLAWSVADSANLYKVTLQGSNLIDNPTGVTAGQSINLMIVQDASGSRVPTWGSNFAWPTKTGGAVTAPTLTTTAGQADILTFFYDGSKFLSRTNQTTGQGLVP